MSDEDRMIEIYIKHRNLKRFVIKKLKEQGINCQETTKNDPKCDILIVNPEDSSRVKEIINQMQNQSN
jgi:outer membrane lipopolysaccharide assembly protein LptE/RlpB